jgi:hypothetical protein
VLAALLVRASDLALVMDAALVTRSERKGVCVASAVSNLTKLGIVVSDAAPTNVPNSLELGDGRTDALAASNVVNVGVSDTTRCRSQCRHPLAAVCSILWSQLLIGIGPDQLHETNRLPPQSTGILYRVSPVSTRVDLSSHECLPSPAISVTLVLMTSGSVLMRVWRRLVTLYSGGNLTMRRLGCPLSTPRQCLRSITGCVLGERTVAALISDECATPVRKKRTRKLGIPVRRQITLVGDVRAS